MKKTYKRTTCPKCKGKGNLVGKRGREIRCMYCTGKGTVNLSRGDKTAPQPEEQPAPEPEPPAEPEDDNTASRRAYDRSRAIRRLWGYKE